MQQIMIIESDVQTLRAAHSIEAQSKILRRILDAQIIGGPSFHGSDYRVATPFLPVELTTEDGKPLLVNKIVVKTSFSRGEYLFVSPDGQSRSCGSITFAFMEPFRNF